MYGNPSFETRKNAEEEGNCGCFPDNPKNGNCENCKHRKKFLEMLNSESSDVEVDEVEAEK